MREWMYVRLINGLLNTEFVAGVDQFIEFCNSIDYPQNGNLIRCPCVKCDNKNLIEPEQAKKHLYAKGFVPEYFRWKYQGETVELFNAALQESRRHDRQKAEDIRRDKISKFCKENGCELYPLLGVVFDNSTATGTFHNASTAAPQPSEEEQMMEHEYLGVNEKSTSSKGKRSAEGDSEYLPGNRRVKKNLEKDKFDALIDVWSKSIFARTEKDVFKAERYKSKSTEVTSSTIEEFSIKDCLAVLNSMEDVGTMSYNKAIEYFCDLNWRKIFLLMPENRRKGWVDNLK